MSNNVLQSTSTKSSYASDQLQNKKKIESSKEIIYHNSSRLTTTTATTASTSYNTTSASANFSKNLSSKLQVSNNNSKNTNRILSRPHPIQTLQQHHECLELPQPPKYIDEELTPVTSTCRKTIFPNTRPKSVPNIPNNDNINNSHYKRIIPTQEQSKKRELQCYRIVYRGIVSLLSSPGISSDKSGAYVSYGEIIASSQSVDVPLYDELNEVLSPPSTPTHHRQYNAAPISPTTSVYSQSTSLSLPLSLNTTTVHSKMISTTTSIRIDEVLTGGYAVENGDLNEFGYLCTHYLEHPIAEKIPPPRLCESGRFTYRVVSRTPLNIMLGPCADAPLTRAMTMPGSLHDVCLRIQLRDDVIYLRLSHRRGWIADRKLVGRKVVMVMSEVEEQNLIHQIPNRRRKRLARRGTAAKQATEEATSPNVTMISDDNSMTLTTAMEQTATSTPTAPLLPPPTPSFFLIRVRAPKGLKILDAPQFQVNRLIHGKAANNTNPSPSIFQTMTGGFAAESSLQRILPRGSLFEASKRIEGLYNNPGSGSIKLSDGSGWAIVPSPEELQRQLRSNHSSQGNAYEEIGNAIPSLPSVWLRILPRAGVVLACPSQNPQQNDATPSFFSTPILKKKKDSNAVSAITLPCGLCVEVDPWEQPANAQARQSFARLRSGIAWIPRHIHNELFSYIIQTPKIRSGKFYFQVIYRRGMKVRRGPSRRAPSILSSNNEPIRYECGEFLLISDIFTMFGPTDTSSSHASNANLSECFGKLHSSNAHQWVHIHSNGRYYLQEQPNPPSIDAGSGSRRNSSSLH